MRRPVRIVLLAFGAVVLALVGAGVGGILWLRLAPRHVPEGQPALARLDEGSLASFKSTFNAGADEVRVLVLLSPT